MKNLRISKGRYIKRKYIIPTIELERFDDGISYLVVAFLGWYIGLVWEMR